MSQERRNWHSNDSGILRKKYETNTDLLVFGYSCKLFRDDEKALQIDQGKHLIPWMGDETLKIDRYDVRGALSDLSKYEGSNIGTSMAWDSLTNEERKVEMMCDEERYRALFHNEDEEALYQEEELKRLHQALSSVKEYGQVAYQYEEKEVESSSNSVEEGNVSDDQQEPFIPPAQLDIPPNMIIPETKKQNAIIEKTAMFINQQGPQMEILLKMKQASNPQFEFLTISCPLHAYYRHVLAIMKTGRYKPSLPDSDKHSKHGEYEDHYLHPSLLSTPSVVELAPSIPSITYKPSADCTYSMLVNKIKSKQEGNFKTSTSSISSSVVPEESDVKEIIGAPVKYTSSQDNDTVDSDKSSSSVVQLVSKSTKRRRRRKLLNFGILPNGQQSPSQSVNVLNYKQKNLSSHLGSLVDSVYDKEISVEEPPTELKVIIDKMASYVVKNGRDFEVIVKNKGDPRFFFLNVGNQFHAYYEQRVRYYKALNKPVATSLLSSVYSIDNDDSVSEDEGIEDSNDIIHSSTDMSNTQEKNTSVVKTSTSVKKPSQLLRLKGLKLQGMPDGENHSTNKPHPVCFSIKKPKEADKLEHSSALPIEESSDEEEEREELGSSFKTQPESVEKAYSSRAEEKKYKTSGNKWAEERVKDKLAQVAKEKLAMKEKEKQLQLERKKRALAFLNLLQKDSHSSSGKPLASDRIRDNAGAGLPTAPSSITSISSDESTEDDNVVHSSAHDKAQASQTLQRILDAVPKERNSRGRKSHQRSSHSHSYSRYGSEVSSKHHHHKSHKRHHFVHRPSHKRSHQSKSTRSHKRRRINDSSGSSSE